MIKVVGIRFRKAGKIYYFDPGTIEIEPGQHVIVETIRGVEYGTAVLGAREIEEEEVIQPLKKVIRISTEADDVLESNNKEREREAFLVCLEKIRKHELQMKLIDCEYTFDSNKLLFYFTADGRIDFRELVKDLASVFKTRIELRQIGVRDETKMIGSIGICGRTLCCHAHLSDFHPVSIKMAKDQNLSLNPAKISGVCGRLMCCLKYEEETYEMLNKNLPRIGASVIVKESGLRGEVIKTNIIRQRVKLVIRKPDGDTEVVEMKIDELEIKGQKHRNEVRIPKEQEKELKKLEKLDKLDKEGKNEQKDKPKRRNNNNNRRNKPNDTKNNNPRNNNDKTELKKETVQKQKSQQQKPQQQKPQNQKPQKAQNKKSPNEKQEASTPAEDHTNKKTTNSNNNKNRNNRNRRNRTRKPTAEGAKTSPNTENTKQVQKPKNKAPKQNKPSGGDL